MRSICLLGSCLCLTVLASCGGDAGDSGEAQNVDSRKAGEQGGSRADTADDVRAVQVADANAHHPDQHGLREDGERGRSREEERDEHASHSRETHHAVAHRGHTAHSDPNHAHARPQPEAGHHHRHSDRGETAPAHGGSDAQADGHSHADGHTHDAAGKESEETTDLTAGEVFERRILPIVRSEKPSSCTECHFGGVELSNYIRKDQATTFAALRQEKLIDVENPDQSRILEFISRRTDKTDPLLVRVREAEYKAFRTWIRAAVRDPQLLATKPGNVSVGSELPVEVIRHMRRDRVLRSFVENIWAEIGRCVSCHSPEKNQRLIPKHGERISWIHPHDPEGTLRQCVEQGIIDTEDPEQSDILLKPLTLVEHGGGPKFALGSRTDKNFRRFLNDYAAVVQKRYRRKEQLPEPSPFVSAPTGQHLRIVDLPDGLGGKLLKADVYRWTDRGWSESPWATAENPIAGKRNLWQSTVFAVAPRGSKRAVALRQDREKPLPGGRYLVKIYIDRQDKTKANRDYRLGEREFFGQVETGGPWKPGYQPPKIIHAPSGPTRQDDAATGRTSSD